MKVNSIVENVAFDLSFVYKMFNELNIRHKLNNNDTYNDEDISDSFKYIYFNALLNGNYYRLPILYKGVDLTCFMDKRELFSDDIRRIYSNPKLIGIQFKLDNFAGLSKLIHNHLDFILDRFINIRAMNVINIMNSNGIVVIRYELWLEELPIEARLK